ncbi:hypothetical protein P5V15_015608 [Pogonomyrmex californicus]
MLEQQGRMLEMHWPSRSGDRINRDLRSELHDCLGVVEEALRRREGHRKQNVQCLFELSRVPRESAEEIHELVDHVQKHLRILHSMNFPTESWEELIVHLTKRNLDNTMRRC